MIITMQERVARVAAWTQKTARRVGGWAWRRAQERSTYVGLAAIAVQFGFPGLGAQLGHLGDLVAIAISAGLVTASTSKHPASQEPSA